MLFYMGYGGDPLTWMIHSLMECINPQALSYDTGHRSGDATFNIFWNTLLLSTK